MVPAIISDKMGELKFEVVAIPLMRDSGALD
jgi:hypothetical protein